MIAGKKTNFNVAGIITKMQSGSYTRVSALINRDHSKTVKTVSRLPAVNLSAIICQFLNYNINTIMQRPTPLCLEFVAL
jgi:hypothetical protein